MNDDLQTNPPADDPATNGAATATVTSEDLAAAKAKAEENYNKFLYAMADFENYKKRIERQFADIATAGKRALLEKILPVVDNLERALSVDSDAGGLRSGVQSPLRGLENVFGRRETVRSEFGGCDRHAEGCWATGRHRAPRSSARL